MNLTRRTLLAATALTATAAAVAVPSLTQAQSADQVVTAQLKVQSLTVLHEGKKTKSMRLATGDRVLTRQAITTTAGAKGTLVTDCSNVGAKAPVFKATLQCTTTYRFGDGQIVATGVLSLGGKPSIPITGGTGAYRGAGGATEAGPRAKGFDSVDVLRFTK